MAVADTKAHLAGSGRPAHGVGEALLNLTHALVPTAQHAFVPLGVEQLGACVQPHLATQRPHLRGRYPQ